METRIKEKSGIIGVVTLRSHPAGTCDELDRLHREGKHEEANALMRKGKLESRKKNVVVSSANRGYDALVQYLISGYTGSFASPLGIAWGEIGTGTATVGSTDVALQAPTNRAPISYAQDLSYLEAIVQFYFPDLTVTNGTYTECGSFLGGTLTIGSGYMFNHALFASPYTKVSGTDTTVECDFTFGVVSGFDTDEFT